MNRYGLILAGGRGTRFWPMSRKTRAKQVLNIAGDSSMIQATVARLAPLLPPQRIWILTNDHLRDEIIRQLPEVPQNQIIAEPEQRNTAPAIGLAAHILHSIDKDAVMGVFPSDHIIAKPKRYMRTVKAAFAAADKGKVAVLGIAPRWPETGYGYVEFPKNSEPGSLEPADVTSFREKPDLKTAKKYVKKGNFYWNAGMFFWRADVVLDNLRRHLPKTATLLAGLPTFGDESFAAQLAAIFPLCENISIDFAVLERADNVVGLACGEIGWNDVGSWDAVYDLLPRDAEENVSRSELASTGSSGNYVDAGKKLVALLGVRDFIIVDTPDALLIADRRRAQEVGDIVKMLEKRQRHDLL
ncbi:MAG: mannose-phosphate guanylyltransferase [Bryobacterales bacterium]|nr:mannose-phosphate guanylyltransferase [Bryobacterales bacterium]